jgi:hypothetical protein
LKVDRSPISLHNPQTAQPSKTESTAAQTSNTNTNTPKDAAPVEATAIDLGDLHKSENFSSYVLEQLKRLAQIREILGTGGTNDTENRKADALALDLLNTIKANFLQDKKNSSVEKNLSVKEKHLGTLEKNIESKKYADAIKGVGQMMELFEMESRGAFTPVKNTNAKGSFMRSIIDTFGSYVIGDVAGPKIVELAKFIGSLITPKNLDENLEIAAKTGFGVAGFFGAEESIKRFIDPLWEKIDHLLNHSLESKTPDLLSKINQSAQRVIDSGLHSVLGLFGKRISQGDNPTPVEHKYSEPLQEKLIDYIKNQKGIESKDKWAFVSLAKEMLLEDYQRHYGKEMPKFLKTVLNAFFACISTEAWTRNLLVSNELAEAVREPTEKIFKLPGKLGVFIGYWVIPNIYIFGGRPAAVQAFNQKTEDLFALADKLGIKISRPTTAANNSVNLDIEKAKTPATASAH